MKPQFKPEEIYLDLSKLSEEQQRKVIALLPKPINKDDYDITYLHFYLIYDDEDCMWWVSTKYFLADKTELTYSQFLDMMGESKEDFAIYKRTFNKIPYPRVEWECNCGFKHCINEGFEQDYRKDNFKEIRLPTGKCLKCKKEIRIQSLEIKEVLQVENKPFDREFILCASLKFQDNIVSGHRHSDCYELIRKMCPNIADTSLPQRKDQGFLTSLNRHVDRKEGWKIAKENNQIKWGLNASDDNEESQLISENLY